MDQRKIGVLLVGALAGLLLGPVFFDESAPGIEFAHVVAMVLGAFVAVVVYELAARRRR